MLWLVGLVVFLAGALAAALLAGAAGPRPHSDPPATPGPAGSSPRRLEQFLDPIARNRGDAVHSEAESAIHQPPLTVESPEAPADPAGDAPQPPVGKATGSTEPIGFAESSSAERTAATDPVQQALASLRER